MILEDLKKYPETKYIFTNQFLAGDLVHSYVDDEKEISFSVQPIGNGSGKLYGVYEQTIGDIVVIFDLSLKYPQHREYCFWNEKFELIFKTNVDFFDNLDKNNQRLEKLNDILGE